jgi:hypothetical protein
MASIIVIAVVLVLDVLAFVLAIGAERRRSYVRQQLSSIRSLHNLLPCFIRFATRPIVHARTRRPT